MNNVVPKSQRKTEKKYLDAIEFRRDKGQGCKEKEMVFMFLEKTGVLKDSNCHNLCEYWFIGYFFNLVFFCPGDFFFALRFFFQELFHSVYIRL